MKPALLGLPEGRIAEARKGIWTVLKSLDSVLADQAHIDLIRDICHPVSICDLIILRGGNRLRVIRNTFIRVRRVFWVAYFVPVPLAVLVSWWLLFLLPGIYALHLALSYLQMCIDVEIAARLQAFRWMKENEPEFRQQIADLDARLTSEDQDKD